MLHLIVNPRAKNIKKALKGVKERLEGAHEAYEIFEGKSREEMTAYVRGLSDSGAQKRPPGIRTA